MRGRGGYAGVAEDGGFLALPTAGTSLAIVATVTRRLLQLPADFPDADVGAGLDFRYPALEFDIIALASAISRALSAIGS
jgi:hypothetical protein